MDTKITLKAFTQRYGDLIEALSEIKYASSKIAIGVIIFMIVLLWGLLHPEVPWYASLMMGSIVFVIIAREVVYFGKSLQHLSKDGSQARLIEMQRELHGLSDDKAFARIQALVEFYSKF